MNGATHVDSELFGGAPFLRLFTRCRLIRSDRSDYARRAGIAVAVAWLPLVILTMAEGNFLRTRAIRIHCCWMLLCTPGS